MAGGKKLRIYLADLAYFNQYSASMITLPLNIGYVASYTHKLHGAEVEFTLFKDPHKLLAASRENPPDVLGLSCYYWNERLDALMAGRIKQLNPDCIVVVGGPHVDTDMEEQFSLYSTFKGDLDFLVMNEGELGFANIVGKILSEGQDKVFDAPIDGATFFRGDDRPVFGKPVGLTLDLDTLPSPTLAGLLDDFFKPEFMPMIQTSRMCPYSCSFCASGHISGKLRAFPHSVVQDEIDYIAQRYREYPHITLYITDDNFGINKRDSLIARHLVSAKEKFGFPRQTFCYFDKRLTPTIKESALLFADMNAGGLQLAVQSFNKDSLKAVKRRNMSDEDIEKAVIWAHDNGLKTSSELIFGLPFETKQSFLDALEFIMHMKVDTMAAHQLLLIKGVELNRKEERKRFNISTKYRPSFASAYDIFDGDFVCESEEVAVSSSHFNYEDYMDVRKVSLMFYIVNAMEYFKKVINYLVENDQNVLPLLDAIMNPPGANAVAGGYEKFVEDFVFDSNSELFDSHEEVAADLLVKFSNNSNRVAAPIRLNVYYASRLIYKEGWFSEVISQYLEDAGVDLRHSTILRELMTISENEWIDIKEPERGNEVMVSKETLEYLNIPVPQSDARQFRLRMSSTERQRKNIESYNEHYMIDDDSYYYNVLDVIQPRSYLRYASLEVEPVFEDVVATE